MYTKLRSRSVAAVVVAAAIAAGIAVTLAGGAAAASQGGKAVTHNSKTTARLEKGKGTRDVGFTG
jgi:hypothetical protein